MIIQELRMLFYWCQFCVMGSMGILNKKVDMRMRQYFNQFLNKSNLLSHTPALIQIFVEIPPIPSHLPVDHKDQQSTFQACLHKVARYTCILQNLMEYCQSIFSQYKFAKAIVSYIIFKQYRKMPKFQYRSIQYASTDCDSSEERDYQISFCKTNPLKHKTQLCKTFSELGYCNYGEKCRFAHGKHQLIRIPKNIELKQRKCNGFWGKGQCNYGMRCQFGHSEPERIENRLILYMAKAAMGTQTSGSKLMGTILTL